MAKRKRKSHRRRRSLSEGLSRRRRRPRRSSGFLSAASSALSKSNLMETGKELIGGGIGGYLGGGLYKMMPNASPMQKALGFGAAAFASHLFGFKNMASGLAGSYGFALSAGMPGMSENMEEHDYADRDALTDMADAMDEDGKPMFLAGDGNYYYQEELEEGEDDDDDDDQMSARPELLADSIYPSYVNSAGY